MNLGIQGKKALVTGGGRGLGRSIASCLVREGARVAVVARTREDLDSFVNEYGDENIGLEYDLTLEEEPAKMVSELKDRMGLPDILVHNVGGNLNITDPFCSTQDWRKIYRFNLEIAVELNQLLVPHLIKQKWGRVVHITSIAALENQGTVPYCSMKAALTAYTRSFGRYVSPDGVAVSAVLPGAVYTEGGYWDMTSKTRPEHVDKYLQERMAIRRFGEPNEIGNVVTFLCSELASFITGSSFTVDGGQGRSFIYDYE
jgi:NAD(P)-dependent dehydrogenase (short-subunit alcohol dehydrogenase family)